MTLSFAYILILALIAASPAVVAALANHDVAEEAGPGPSIRAAALFSLSIGLLILLGATLGRWIQSMMQEDARWIADIPLYVVGLKMIFTSRKLNTKATQADIGQLIPLVLLSLANGFSALWMSASMGLLGMKVSLFAANTVALVFLLSLLGFYLPSRFPILLKAGPVIYIVCGVSLILFTLIVL